MKTTLTYLATFVFLCVMTLFVAISGAFKGVVREVRDLWKMW